MTNDVDAVNASGLFKISTEEPSGAEFGDSPLLDFIGVGAGYEVRGGVGKGSGRAWQRVNFRHREVDVLDSTDVYAFDTSEVSLFYSDPTKTPKKREGQGTNDWEIFCDSLRHIYPQDQHGNMLANCFGGQVANQNDQPMNPGRRMRMKRLPSFVRVGPNEAAAVQVEESAAGATPESDAAIKVGEEAKRLRAWHDEVRPCWQIVWVDGVGALPGWTETTDGAVPGGYSLTPGVTPTVSSNGGSAPTSTPATSMLGLGEMLLGLADGKTVDAFNAEATNIPQVVASPSISTQIANGQWVPAMINMGVLTRDEQGVLHCA